MKKAKKIALFFAVGLTLFAPIVGLIPTSQGKASAVTAADASPEDLVQSYLSVYAVVYCIGNSDLNDGTFGSGLERSKAESYDWWGGSGGGAPVGYLDSTGDKDGEVNCNDAADWLKPAAALWGYKDGVETICNAGFKRKGASNNQSVSDCISGGGNATAKFEYRETSGGSVSPTKEAFLKSVNAKFYGKQNSTAFPSMNDAMRYVYYQQSFLKLCGSNEVDETTYTDAQVKDDKNLFLLKDADGTRHVYLLDNVPDDRTTRGKAGSVSLSVSKQKLSCDAMADGANKYAAAYAEATGITNGTIDDGGTGDGTSPEIECADSIGGVLANPANWIMCPLVNAFAAMANGVENVITGMLCINESDIFEGDMTCSTGSSSESGTQESRDAFYAAWNVFRIMAIGFILIAGLFMVISQGLGFEIFDAYTVKKVLPRILIAGIAISLSWPLLEFLVRLSNGLGIGIRSLIYAPFQEVGNVDVLNGGSGAIGALFAGGAFAALGALGLLSFIATAALAILIAFFVLVLRNVLVILLIILAPLAIAMYVLPNTEKYFKTWWDWLFKALMVFPIITAMIAVGHVFAAITSQRSDSALSAFVAFAAYFAPYFLIPAAFRFAGGALATIGGFANDRSRGAFDRLSKFRQNQSQQRMGYYGQKYGDRARQFQAQQIRSLNDKASGSGRFGGMALRGLSNTISPLGGIEERMSAINARTAKHMNDTIATGKDDEIRGLTVNMKAAKNAGALYDRSGNVIDHENGNGLMRVNKEGLRQYKSLGGQWVNEADVINGHKEWGRDVAAQQAAVSYEMRKAMTDDQVQGISERYASLAKDQFGMTDGQATGAWIGAGFENQNQHIEFKNTDWKSGKLDAAKFSKELYEKKGSYQLSQMSAHTIKQMKNAYDVGDTDTKRRIQSVAETFMQRGGAGGGIANVNDDGVPIQAPQVIDGGGGRNNPNFYQVSSQGPGHVAEAVRDMAVHVGVYKPLDPSTETRSSGPPSTHDRQN